MVRRSVPVDRVLSSIYKETSSGYSLPVGGNTETWRGNDEGMIGSLLNKWGQAPSELCLENEHAEQTAIRHGGDSGTGRAMVSHYMRLAAKTLRRVH